MNQPHEQHRESSKITKIFCKKDDIINILIIVFIIKIFLMDLQEQFSHELNNLFNEVHLIYMLFEMHSNIC